MVASGVPSPHASSDLYWEMGRQTAVRRGKWKLVLNGQLMEGTDPIDDVFLADLEADPGEMINVRDGFPQVVDELREAAERWRRGIEERWEREWKPRRRPPADHSIDARPV
jgi:arylsulfatase A-like enzyme